jgi:hypothetical protein
VQGDRQHHCYLTEDLMSEPGYVKPIGRYLVSAAVLLLSWQSAGASVLTADDKADSGQRVAAGRCAAVAAAMVRREAPGQPWRVVDQGETLYTGDLLVGTSGAALDSENGAVRLFFQTDLTGESPYPVIEAAIVLRSSKQADLEFVLDRGRVDLINRKESGPVKVRVHVREASWDLTLAEPGAEIALELYGRWPRGVPFTRNPGPKDVPTADLLFLVLKGNVTLAHKGREHAMSAPPGPALMEWDSVTGQDETPHRLEKLPPWATAGVTDTPEMKVRKTRMERFHKTAIEKSIDQSIQDLLNSDDPGDRRLAVFAMGALDNLAGLGKALSETKHADVWDNGVLVLRHWIGRGPGQDQVLFKRLEENGNFTAVDAETVLQLLHSYDENELARPEIYETLIAYLNHDKLAIRGLAYWHLSRLVPAGKDLGYNPQDPKEARDAAIQKWKKLIPAGQMPPHAKPRERK